MSFLIHSIDNENIVPWEYFPCSDALMTGEVLAFNDGKLRSALIEDLGAKKPLYLSMCEKAAGEEEIPAIRIRDDMVLEGMAFPEEGVDILEGMRGYLISLVSMTADDDEGILELFRKTFRASHFFKGMSGSDAEGEAENYYLFEVLGVSPPEEGMGELGAPKVLIRLIG